MLSDQQAIEAVQRFVEGRDEQPVPHLADAAHVEWFHLMTGEVVRCIETRSESVQKRQAPFDLSDRPQYEGNITSYSLARPKGPSVVQTVKLVRTGSVEETHCPCGNGKVPCPRCQGCADLPCDLTEPCQKCRGSDACLKCEGIHRSADPSPDHLPERRVACLKCGAADTACPGCKGRGKVPCTRCAGSGRRSCPGCDDGTVPHRSCGGQGSTVTWTEGLIQRDPSHTSIKEGKDGVFFRVWNWARGVGQWETIDVAVGETLPDGMARQFRRLAERHLAPRKGQIASRATFSYLPLARVTVPQHPNRVYHVALGRTGPVVYQHPSARWAGKTAVITLAVVVVVVTLFRLLP